jgi:hypothetical protein
MQWLQDPNQCNVDNLNNVRREDNIHFKNKKEYLKAKINELESSSKINNTGHLYQCINEFKKGYQPRTNIVKDEKVEWVTNSHSILARCRNHFSQLLNVHGVNDHRQTEIHTAELLVPKSSALEVEMAVEKPKRHKTPGNDQISEELIKAGGRTTPSEIHKLVHSIWNEEELPEKWKESVIAPIYNNGDKTDCRNYRDISRLSTTYKILSSVLLSRLTPCAKEITGDHQCGFGRNRSTTDQIFCIRQILEKKWEYKKAVYKLFTNFKKAYDSVRREILFNIHNEFGIPMQLVKLIKL